MVVECAHDDCSKEATVLLHFPTQENKHYCAAHARSLAKRQGVVPEPITDQWDE